MGWFRLFMVSAVLLGTAGGFTGRVLAEEATPPGPTIEERLDALDQKQKILERNWELQKGEAQEKVKSGAVAVAGKEGFLIKSGDGNSRLRIGGFVHADGRFFFDDDLKPATNTLIVRRAFLTVDGAVGRIFVFRIQPDFGGGKVVLQDAYLDARFAPPVQLLVGKTKVPFLLERIQSATDRRFVELAFPNNLSPNRDIGAFLHGDLSGGALSYALGIFNGLPDGDTSDGDANDGKDVVARLFAQPFKAAGIGPLEGLGLGIAATYGDQTGSVDTAKKSVVQNLPSYKTSGQQTFFTYFSGTDRSDFSADNNVISDGKRTRISPQAFYYRGPFGMLGEYVRTRQEVRRGSVSAALTNSAWQAAAYYALTGEKNSFGHIDPARPFDLSRGRFGALELVARYAVLRVDGDAFPLFADPARSARRASAWAAGFNWYPDAKVKLAANWERTTFSGGASGNADREAEQALLSRVEVAF